MAGPSPWNLLGSHGRLGAFGLTPATHLVKLEMEFGVITGYYWVATLEL